MIMVVRREVLEKMTKDEKWLERLNNAKTTVDLERVIDEYSKEKKLNVVDVDLDKNHSV